MSALPPQRNAEVLRYQRNEITEHQIYSPAGQQVKDQRKTAQILEKIAADELRHYNGWKKYTGVEVAPDRLKALAYYWISRIFGFTFGIKLMERGEESAGLNYSRLRRANPRYRRVYPRRKRPRGEIARNAGRGTAALCRVGGPGLERCLGRADRRAGRLTLALQNTQLIALSGSITGIAAALSMAASEYLSTKSEASTGENRKNPIKAAVYTGIAYI